MGNLPALRSRAEHPADAQRPHCRLACEPWLWSALTGRAEALARTIDNAGMARDDSWARCCGWPCPFWTRAAAAVGARRRSLGRGDPCPLGGPGRAAAQAEDRRRVGPGRSRIGSPAAGSIGRTAPVTASPQRPLYGPGLVRKLSPHELQTSRSTSRDSGHDQIVAQLRFEDRQCRL